MSIEKAQANKVASVARFASLCILCLVMAFICVTLPACNTSDVSSSPYLYTHGFDHATANFTMTVQLTNGTAEDLQASHAVSATFKGTFDITRSSNTQASFELSKLSASITAGDAVLEYNSANTYSGENALRVIPFKALVGCVFDVSFAYDGSIRTLDGFSKVTENLNKEAYSYGSTVIAQSTIALDEFLNKNTIQYIITNILGSIPSNAISPGTYWDRTFTDMAPHNHTLSDRVTYDGSSETSSSTHIYSVSGTIDPVQERTEDELREIFTTTNNKPIYDMNGSSNGTITVYEGGNGNTLRNGSISGLAVGNCYIYSEDATITEFPISISRQFTYSVTKTD